MCSITSETVLNVHCFPRPEKVIPIWNYFTWLRLKIICFPWFPTGKGFSQISPRSPWLVGALLLWGGQPELFSWYEFFPWLRLSPPDLPDWKRFSDVSLPEAKQPLFFPDILFFPDWGRKPLFSQGWFPTGKSVQLFPCFTMISLAGKGIQIVPCFSQAGKKISDFPSEFSW